MEKKIYTSQSFVRRPLATFRSAYEGCKTIINHAQYPEGVFELTYRKREVLTINKMPNIASTITAADNSAFSLKIGDNYTIPGIDHVFTVDSILTPEIMRNHINELADEAEKERLLEKISQFKNGYVCFKDMGFFGAKPKTDSE